LTHVPPKSSVTTTSGSAIAPTPMMAGLLPVASGWGRGRGVEDDWNYGVVTVDYMVRCGGNVVHGGVAGRARVAFIPGSKICRIPSMIRRVQVPIRRYVRISEV